jgi:SAM-dependent methyltransferase
MERNVILPDMDSADAYDAIAPFYARHWGTRFFGSAKELFSDQLLRHVEWGATVLDLCCGTGDFAEWLDGKGMIVTGVDNSIRMLACARAKVPYAQFYKTDMRTFQLPFQFDFATCFYNSINHALTLPDLRRVLRSVRRHLRPGGRFLFDVVEENGYLDSWEADEVVHLDDRRCEVRYRYDQLRAIAFCHIVIGETAGEQQEYVIHERPFALRTLRIELKRAGFTVESVTSVREAVPLKGRLAILARAIDPEVILNLQSVDVIDVGRIAEAAWITGREPPRRKDGSRLVRSPLCQRSLPAMSLWGRP